MSLRDQLLKAGLVDKKKHRQVNRELKKKRKKKQSKRDKKAVVEAREAEAQRIAREAEIARRLERKQQLEAEREEGERRRRVRNLLRAYQVRPKRGPVPFFHLTPDRGHAHRMWVPESWAWDLRKGALAIAWLTDGDDPDYVVLPRAAAERVREHAPERILFFNDEAPPDDDPADKPFGLE